MYYDDILKTIERNAGGITENVRAEIYARLEARYYMTASEDAVTNRVSRVIEDVRRRLENWLDRNEPKDLSFDRYARLGAVRQKQGMPLEELAAVLLMIEREIRAAINTLMAADQAYTCDERTDINFYVNLICTGIIRAVTAGYRSGPASAALKPGHENPFQIDAFTL